MTRMDQPSINVPYLASTSLPVTNNATPLNSDFDGEVKNLVAMLPVGAVAAEGIRDAYTRSEDGHYVGHDGFVVPQDFREFHERFPKYVKGFIRRRWQRASEAEVEDRESELLIFLMSLPEQSKFRMPGFNGFEFGCSDRIQIFNPENSYGASASRFFHYINMCLLNHFCSLAKKASSNPIRRYNTLSLYSTDNQGQMVDDDYIYTMTSEESKAGVNYDHVIQDGIFVAQFIRFVDLHNPELVSVIDAIQEAETYVEAQGKLGMTEKLFIRARNRLVVLHAAFDKGEEPPRQRKVYRDRVAPASTQIAHKISVAV
jgi:hypothetical protein